MWGLLGIILKVRHSPPKAPSEYLGQGGGALPWEDLKSFSNDFYPWPLSWGLGRA